MAGEVVVDAPPNLDHEYDETGANPRQSKKKRGLYSPTALANAYKLVKKDGVSVRRAAILFNVPQTTLRDRTAGWVDVNVLSAGGVPLFTNDEEQKLVEHFKRMAEYGYGYTRKECIDIAFDYAVQLGKRKQGSPPSLKWFYAFLKRRPELKGVIPRTLDHTQDKMASKISKFFENLKELLIKHELNDKPHLIFNVDEKGITVNHKSPYIVAGQNITIIGCGECCRAGYTPFYVFPGKRMKADLLSGAAPGSNGTVSETGMSNGSVFRTYLEQHYLKFTPGSSDQKKLLLLDDHESHASVGITEWALEHNIVLCVLPPHCSHILQPLEIGGFGSFRKIYDHLCHQRMLETSAVITRYNVCEVASKSYLKSVSAENLISSFHRAGIYPFNADAVKSKHVHLIQAEEFDHSESETSQSQKTIEGDTDQIKIDMFKQKGRPLKKIKNGTLLAKARNTMIIKIVTDKEISEDVLQQMKELTDNQNKNKLNQRKKATSNEAQNLSSLLTRQMWTLF